MDTSLQQKYILFILERFHCITNCWFYCHEKENLITDFSFFRFRDPNEHGFILDFLFSKAAIYAELKQPVKYILDVMKLDVPNLFTDSQSGTSGPGENFKELLHSYIASNGLQRELLKNVDVIMVSLIWCYYNATIYMYAQGFFEARVSDFHTCGENGNFSMIVIYIVCTYMLHDYSIYAFLTLFIIIIFDTHQQRCRLQTDYAIIAL